MSEVLLQAIRDRHSIEEIESLLVEGAEIGFQNDEGMTALHEATLNLDIPMMRFLLVRGAQVGQVDTLGRSALNHVFAEYQGDYENDLLPAINVLLEFHAAPNHAANDGDTLIQWAAFNGYTGIVTRLLAAGVSPLDAMDDALEGENQEMIELLENASNPADSLSSELDTLQIN